MNAKIRCSTRFDITATGVKRGFKAEARDSDRENQSRGIWQRQRNQQSNWETINQIISLRTLPEEISQPRRDDQNIWSFEFTVPDVHSLGNDSDELCLLREDAHGVPMLTGLDEEQSTGEFVNTDNQDRNTWFDIITINNE